MRRANKYRYSLEKHCCDTYYTVYCFCYFNKYLTNKSERTAAFYAALGQGAPVDENDPFADLEPDIFEEKRNEIVVHED